MKLNDVVQKVSGSSSPCKPPPYTAEQIQAARDAIQKYSDELFGGGDPHFPELAGIIVNWADRQPVKNLEAA